MSKVLKTLNSIILKGEWQAITDCKDKNGDIVCEAGHAYEFYKNSSNSFLAYVGTTPPTEDTEDYTVINNQMLEKCSLIWDGDASTGMLYVKGLWQDTLDIVEIEI